MAAPERDREANLTDAPLIARGLRKSYRGRPAVDDVDLTVLPGEVYGFLGPNGAGKTTTMRMLLGLVKPDAGQISLFGHDAQANGLTARRKVAGIIEEPRLYTYMSGRRNLKLLSSYDLGGAGPEVIEQALEAVELTARADDRVSDYSQGMRQRLGIAACLIRRPQLLLLDEPANGLDPAGIRFLRRLVRNLAADGITVFLSSHLLVEVQELCDRVAIVNAGKIVYEGELDELRARAGRRYRLASPDPDTALKVISRIPGIAGATVTDAQTTTGQPTTARAAPGNSTATGDPAAKASAAVPERVIEFTISADEDLLALTREAVAANLVIHALIPEQLTLERVFFELTETPLEPTPQPAEVA